MGLRNSKPSLLPPEEINPKPSVLLPEDIIEEIFSRLPAKSLLRFRCVSKSWRSLIDSKFFIKKHYQNITKNNTDAHQRVIFYCDRHGLNQCSMQSYYEEPSVDPSPFDDPKMIHLMKDTEVVGHCDGVLCLLKDPGCFFLWNPTTRVSTELPKLGHLTTKLGFGWDEASDAYKVFAVVRYRGGCIGKIYSTKTDSWKTVDPGSFYLRVVGEYGVFACGNLHWHKKSGLDIETFDLNSEVFGMIHHPFIPEVGHYLRLFESGWKGSRGCLGLVCQSIHYHDKTPPKQWVMKQYGVKESWVELTEKMPSSKSYLLRSGVFLH